MLRKVRRATRNGFLRYVLIATAGFSMGAATLAFGAGVPAANGVYHGCYNNATGIVRVLGDPATSPANCITAGSPQLARASWLLETPISWNQSGQTGVAGPMGPTGKTGEAGPVGAQGIPGGTGPQGIRGETGPAGERGLTGATGPTGASGGGVSSLDGVPCVTSTSVPGSIHIHYETGNRITLSCDQLSAILAIEPPGYELPEGSPLTPILEGTVLPPVRFSMRNEGVAPSDPLTYVVSPSLTITANSCPAAGLAPAGSCLLDVSLTVPHSPGHHGEGIQVIAGAATTIVGVGVWTLCNTHDNGLGGRYDFCHILGVPGDPSTYDLALAERASSGSPIRLDCGGLLAVQARTAYGIAVWVFQGQLAGHVRESADGFCPTASDPTWN